MDNKYNATVEEFDKDTAVYFMRDLDFIELYDDMNPQLQMESFTMWMQVNE